MHKRISAVDLFCGAGGLTHGFILEGIRVAAGVDTDPTCEYPYVKNNSCRFLLRDVVDLDPEELKPLFPKKDWKLIAGCAPCQPFSTYSQGSRGSNDEKWKLLYSFAKLVESVRPDIVTMENVPKLAKHYVFDDFIAALEKLGYYVIYYPEVDCLYYGIPQSRKRLVLFASLYGVVDLVDTTHSAENFRTVRNAIGSMSPIRAGESSKKDPLHFASGLSKMNLKRIRASRPGGTWRDWDKSLRAKCHQKKSGRTYPSVYGRMKWDEPSPTITTQCYGFGNGRFGHPDQDRAISLREAALLQTFPKDYAFTRPGDRIYFERVGRLIGNAVPVELARVIARSLLAHLREHNGN
jgi:DNA (cytosine-5)-methyltransferase 1